jgi:hypothetical protein
MSTRSSIVMFLVSRARPVRKADKLNAICGQTSTGSDFLRVIRILLPIIPPTAPHLSSSINLDWYSRPNSGQRTEWTQSHPTAETSRTNFTAWFSLK